MKKAILLAAVFTLTSASAFAGSYLCRGNDLSSRNKDRFETTLKVNSGRVMFQDMDGDDMTLSRDGRSRGTKYAVYADYGYDGYGGYIRFALPLQVANSRSTLQQKFVAYYDQDVYSEAGKVGEVRVKMVCVPNSRL